jgi:trehalose 6-phosphate phosphatase
MAPPSALARWDEIASRLAGARPVLFLDYDGTLAPLAPTPDLATLPGATRAVLARVAAHIPVAILSGRDREDVAAKVGIPDLVYAGCHGFDIAGGAGSAGSAGGTARSDPRLRREVGPGIPAEIAAAAAELTAALGDLSGVLIEPKRFALSVHYRLASQERVPEIERAVDQALAAHPALRKGLGKKLFELRPKLSWHKGKALLWILCRLGGCRAPMNPEIPERPDIPLYIGDDVTDEDAFRAVAARGIGIVVTHDADLGRETAATYSLRDPEEVREWLERLAELSGSSQDR